MKTGKKRIRLLGAAAAGLLLCGHCTVYGMSVEGNAREISGPVEFTQPKKGDWYRQGGLWFFQTPEGPVKNSWICIENEKGGRDWFCFDAEGIMLTGWQKSGSGNWYYLRETEDERQGAMERGFILDASDGRCYYMDPATGVMRTGWIFYEGNAYYFAETGEGSVWFRDGTLRKWVNSGTGRPCGSMYRNERTPDGSLVDAQGRKV